MSKSKNYNNNHPQNKKGFGCFKIVLVIIFIFIASPFILFYGFTYFVNSYHNKPDEDILRNYKPLPAIADIAEKMGVSTKGKAWFYKGDPVFIDTTTYGKYCMRDKAEGELALACFHHARPGGGPFGKPQIYLLQIDNPAFEDHKYGSAVHEFLHYAYWRLPKSEKESLDPLISKELEKRLDNDPHLINIVKIAAKKGGSDDILNEMHSKFAVEYADLSPELEKYYSQYFTNRQIVVNLFQNTKMVKNTKRIDQLRAETDQLSTKIDVVSVQIEAAQKSGARGKQNELVTQGNNLVYQYNAKIVEGKKLYQEIDEFYKLFNPDYVPKEIKGE